MATPTLRSLDGGQILSKPSETSSGDAKNGSDIGLRTITLRGFARFLISQACGSSLRCRTDIRRRGELRRDHCDVNLPTTPLAIDILRTHPMVISGGVLVENSFFTRPDDFIREVQTRTGPTWPYRR